VKYFSIEQTWDCLLKEWEDQKKTATCFKQYFELLFLVKSESRRDEVWFSFFGGIHQHAAIVAGLLCSKFNHITNKLELGSMTLKDFSVKGVIKSFKDPGVLVKDHLNKIMTKELKPQIFTNTFHLSSYIPKQGMGEKQDATTFINSAIYQSSWISNFTRSSAATTLLKNISKWLETTLQHSTKDTSNFSQYQPMVTRGHNIIPQKDTTVNKFKTDIFKVEQNDWFVYGYP
jgi:hypothetical protein